MMFKKYMPILAISVFALTGCGASEGTSGAANATATPASSPAVSAEPAIPAGTPTAAATTAPNTNANAPANVPMKGVTAVRLADAKSGWIGGQGFIAHTNDGGAKWQVQYKAAGDVKQIFALNGQEAWATVGDDAKLLNTKDGGQHWSSVGQVPNAAFLHFTTKQEAFSGNAHTVDGGIKWTTLPVPKGIVGDAYFHDANNGWVVKGEKDSIEIDRTQDGGKTWKSVMSRKSAVVPTGAVIRSAGANDAWVELIGESGMTQTSYSLFHTKDGGKNWQTVLANSTAGGGPAPGFPVGDNTGPKNTGTKPGPLYVVSPDVAFMGGQCPSCDKPNSVGSTKDGGKTWVNGKETFTGYGELLLAMADGSQGWLLTNDSEQPSVMYTTASGGVNWNKVHTFDAPK
ncbi:YCF48-related protein [Paenibacillus ferrarius]|nr:YCF48-related protein [Paenibacillus ferrarius]